MSNARVVADTFIVVPKSDDLIFSTRDEVFTLLHDSKCIKLSRLRAIKHTDRLSIEAVPVSDFSVGSCCEELRLIWVEDDLLEHGGLKEALDSNVGNNVPDNARSVV